MEKVKVNKNVFEALKRWDNNYGRSLEFVLNVIYEQNGFSSKEYLPLNDLSVDDFCKCFIIGYELEMTPEEKILMAYQGYCENELDRGALIGIKFTLNTLGLKIKGINS